MTVRLERLSEAHRPLLNAFQNDVPEHGVFLQRWALRHHHHDVLCRTWVAIDASSDAKKIAGFFTLQAASLEHATARDYPTLPRFPVPAALLAHLAVDRRLAGQGLESWLFDASLHEARALVREGHMRFRVLTAEAMTNATARFYERRGMTRITGAGWPCRMVVALPPPPFRGRKPGKMLVA